MTIATESHALDDTTLAGTLSAVPSGKSVEARVSVLEGPLYHLRHLRIEGAVPPDARAKLGLAPGQPAIASEVLAAGARLLAAMQEDGYALATVEPPDATADPQNHAIDVTFKAAEGRRAVIGQIDFAGLSSVNESFVRRRRLLHPGERYEPSKIDQARRDLAALGVFSGVSVHAGNAIAPDGSIPVTYDFQEWPQHAVGITGAFSTDLGGSLTTTWSDRDLFGNAEQLNLSAASTGLGGTAVKGLGYNAGAQFLKPGFLHRDQTLEFDLTALKQDLQAYDQQAVIAGASLLRKISPLWTISLGLSAEAEKLPRRASWSGCRCSAS